MSFVKWCVIQLTKLGLTFSDYGLRNLYPIQKMRHSFILIYYHTGLNVIHPLKKTYWLTTRKQVLTKPSKVQKLTKKENRGGKQWQGSRKDKKWEAATLRISWCMCRDFPTFGTVIQTPKLNHRFVFTLCYNSNNCTTRDAPITRVWFKSHILVV